MSGEEVENMRWSCNQQSGHPLQDTSINGTVPYSNLLTLEHFIIKDTGPGTSLFRAMTQAHHYSGHQPN